MKRSSSFLRAFLIFVSSTAIMSGCQLFDPQIREYERLLDTQKIVINPYSPEYSSRHGSGFVIYMRREEIRRLNAPYSEEFKAFLEKQLLAERSNGNNYCPDGYKFVDLIYFTHWYPTISFDCKGKDE
jgi:hypothetical protein